MPAEQSIQQLNPRRKAPKQVDPTRNPSTASISSDQTNSSTPKVWAQRYHALGMNVVPWGPDKSPAVVKPGKAGKPDERFQWAHWQQRRQNSQQIAKFPWAKATGVAAICGPVSGNLVCIDFDHPQSKSVVERFLQHLGLPASYDWIVRTPSGGFHVWMRAPELDLQGKRKLDRPLQGGGHVELRFGGHCTTLPPTRNREGRQYAFLDGQLPAAAPEVVDPDVLLSAYNSVCKAESQSGRSSPCLPMRNASSPYAEAALRSECEAVLAAAQGTRNNALNKAAYNLGQLVGGGEIERHQVESSLLQAATENGLSEHEATATIRSGIEAGLATPRKAPAPPEPEHKARPDTSKREPGQKRKSKRRRPKDNRALTVALAYAIQSENHFAKDGGKKLYRYHQGVYLPDGEDFIQQLVKELLTLWDMEADWSTYRTREVIGYIRTGAPDLWKVPPTDTLNVENGLIDVATRTLRPHSPDFLSPVQLPITFRPGVFPVFWDQFCRSTFPDDAYEAGVHWQNIAWLMLPITSLQKALILVGDGGNGKSRYLAGVSAFLGHQHITSLSLQKIENDRFATARLLGKLANICPDLPSRHLQETAIFKQLTGDDGRLTGEYKGQDSFEFPCFARLVFSANQPPVSCDMSEGFYRRWIVQPFTRTFTGADRRDSREIDAQLTAPLELSGVLNMALQYLPQVQQNGITETASMKEAHREFRAVTDPLAIWLEQETFEDENVYIEKQALLRKYNASFGAPYLSAKAFSQAFRRLRPKINEAQRPWGENRRARVYIGIGCHDLFKKQDS